jgi:hypothetical protein
MTQRSGPPLAALRRATRATPPPGAGERCELCATPISEPHQHLVDLESRALLCSCRACALLFTDEHAAQRYRTVPGRYQIIGELDGDLPFPVGLAFVFHHSGLGRMVAFYPGPAGATESELPPETWEWVGANHSTLTPDVEALLIRRVDTGIRSYVVPIDACYELAGRLRTLWQGFDGGPAARKAIDAYFEGIEEKAR